MKLKEFLNEDYLEVLDIILKNPTKQEFSNFIKKIKSEAASYYGKDTLFFLRFILDSRGNLYIVSGYNLIHLDMALKIGKTDKKFKDVFRGYVDYNIVKNKFAFPMKKSNVKEAMKNKNLKKLVGSDVVGSLNEDSKELNTILVNPTKQELLKYAREIEKTPNPFKMYSMSNRIFFRFVLDRKRNIYVVNGYAMIHSQLVGKMRKIDNEAKSIYNGFIDYDPEIKKFKSIENLKSLEKKNKNLKRLFEDINEETEDIFRTVLLNPTKTEFRKLVNEIYRTGEYNKNLDNIDFRFVYDKGKDNLFIGSAYGILHYSLREKARKLNDNINPESGYVTFMFKTKKFEFSHKFGRYFDKKILKNKNLKKLTESNINEESDELKTVLVNPTKQELLKFAKEIEHSYTDLKYNPNSDIFFRFILDEEGNVYLANGYAMTHSEMAEKIKYDGAFRGYIEYNWKTKNFESSVSQGFMKKNKNFRKLLKLTEETEEKTILVNPTKQELLKLERKDFKNNAPSFRYIVTTNGDFYFALARSSTHENIREKLRSLKPIPSVINKGYITYFIKEKMWDIYGAKSRKFKSNKNWKKVVGNDLLNESLDYVKFKYDNYHNDKVPRVKVIDTEYPGRKGQKTYGQRKDLLGWNINYVKNKRYAKRAIDDIESFAKLLSADKDEVYKRIKYFFPEQAKFIRRYMRKHIKGLKHKKGMLWRKTTYPEIKAYNKEAF